MDEPPKFKTSPLNGREEEKFRTENKGGWGGVGRQENK